MGDSLRTAYHRRQYLLYEAQKLQLPADPLAELALFEAEALGWPDDERLPQKQSVLDNLRRARAAHEKGNIKKLKLFWLVMLKNRDNAQDNYLEAATSGKKGGKAPKIKEWATLAAKRLLEISEGLTVDQAWEKIPDTHKAWKVETLKKDYRVYRDGEKIVFDTVAITDDGK